VLGGSAVSIFRSDLIIALTINPVKRACRHEKKSFSDATSRDSPGMEDSRDERIAGVYSTP
jgi:hypothetical protein